MPGKNAIKNFLLILLLVITVPFSVYGQNSPFDESTTITDVEPGESPFAVSSDEAVAAAKFEIDGSWVNVRSGPGMGNSVLDTLPRGSKGTKIGQHGNWTKIKFDNGLTGWVYSELLAQVSSPEPQPSTPSENVDTSSRSYLDTQISRWERHLGGEDDLLDYSRFWWWWRLSRAERNFKKGNYERALELARKANGNQLESAFMQAKCLAKLGKTQQAERILKILEKHFEDLVMTRQLNKIAEPYIDEPIVFKFGGFDDIETYKQKKNSGNRVGLNSDEYYERFVDINTWEWRSDDAYREFQKIGGIDCSGFVQMVQKEAYEKTGVDYPINKGRTSTRGLWSEKYTNEINPGVKPPPPPDIRPGDMILLDYGHNRYGHSMIYKGQDSQGNIIVLQMGDTAQQAILPAHKYQHYKGTFRMKGMDKVREQLTA